jgi:hypothetical protein
MAAQSRRSSIPPGSACTACTRFRPMTRCGAVRSWSRSAPTRSGSPRATSPARCTSSGRARMALRSPLRGQAPAGHQLRPAPDHHVPAGICLKPGRRVTARPRPPPRGAKARLQGRKYYCTGASHASVWSGDVPCLQGSPELRGQVSRSVAQGTDASSRHPARLPGAVPLPVQARSSSVSGPDVVATRETIYYSALKTRLARCGSSGSDMPGTGVAGGSQRDQRG